jgi:tRNA (cytidine/uridine-2'-O-)-methyltransferase
VLHVVLVEPEIPPNTGNIARLCLATGSRLHLIEPLGFSIDDRALRRAGMDYWTQCDVVRWKSFEAFRSESGARRLWLLTTKASTSFWDVGYENGDALVFGRETRGLPESLLAENPDHCLKIPMRPEARSLNLATSAGIVLFEALRQTLTLRSQIGAP